MNTNEQITIGDTTYTLAYADAAPPLSSELYAALKASIEDIGIQTPILIDQDKNVLDGHHRLKIAAELELADDQIPLRVHSMPRSEDERFRAAVELNTKRRQAATAAQRRRWLEQIRTACVRRNRPTPSSHELGQYFGVSHTTILRDLRALDAADDEELERARKLKSETQLKVTYVQRAVTWLEEEDSAVIDGEFDVEAATAALQHLLARAKKERDRAKEEYQRLTKERQDDDVGEAESDANDEPAANADESAGEERSGERDALSVGENSKSADPKEMSDVGAEYIGEIESYAAGAGGET